MIWARFLSCQCHCQPCFLAARSGQSGHPAAAARVRYIRGPVDGSVPLHGFRLARTHPSTPTFSNLCHKTFLLLRRESAKAPDVPWIRVVRPPIAVTAVHTQILSPGEFRANLVLCCPTHWIELNWQPISLATLEHQPTVANANQTAGGATKCAESLRSFPRSNHPCQPTLTVFRLQEVSDPEMRHPTPNHDMLFVRARALVFW